MKSCRRHSHHPRHPKGKQKSPHRPYSLITWTRQSLEHAIPTSNHHHDDCPQFSSSSFPKTRSRSRQLNGTGLQFQCPPGDQATKPEVVMSGQLDNTREINVWFSNGGHHSVERPWEARRRGSLGVAASVGLRPQDGGPLQSRVDVAVVSASSLSWIANLPWRCRR